MKWEAAEQEGGGAGGGPGGGSAATGAITSASIAGNEPVIEEVEEHFLDVTFMDKSNTPLGGKE